MNFEREIKDDYLVCILYELVFFNKYIFDGLVECEKINNFFVVFIGFYSNIGI